MSERRNERARRAILKALAQADGPAGSQRLCQAVQAMGLDVQPRTVRLHLLRLDREGLTRFVSRRRGRDLTDRGREELARSNVLEKVGFVAARVNDLGYRMTFDPAGGTGSLVINVAELREADLPRATIHLEPVYQRRLSMGSRLALAREGETLGGHLVSAGRAALGTVCSIALNGILLKRGIPVTSRFGGLLEWKAGRPERFVELVEYRGTSVDPLELFIRAGMTRVLECARTGSGLIGASFREVPTVALDDLKRLLRELRTHGFGAVLAVGRPNQPLLDIPVTEGHTGIVVMGGLNPIAALVEAGIPAAIRSLAGLEDYGRFTHFREIAFRARRESPLID